MTLIINGRICRGILKVLYRVCQNCTAVILVIKSDFILPPQSLSYCTFDLLISYFVWTLWWISVSYRRWMNISDLFYSVWKSRWKLWSWQNILATTECTVRKFGTDTHSSQTMNSNDSSSASMRFSFVVLNEMSQCVWTGVVLWQDPLLWSDDSSHFHTWR